MPLELVSLIKTLKYYDRVPIFYGVCIWFQERHKALEEMGVSVETSGIKVQHSRYFLVNLNADPSLNELLVYYLKVSDLLL